MNLLQKQYYYNNNLRDRNKTLFLDPKVERMREYSNKVSKRNLGGYLPSSYINERNYPYNRKEDLSSKYSIYSNIDEKKNSLNYNNFLLNKNETRHNNNIKRENNFISYKENNNLRGNNRENKESIINSNLKKDEPYKLLNHHTPFNDKKIEKLYNQSRLSSKEWDMNPKTENSKYKFYSGESDILNNHYNDNYISNYIPNLGRKSALNNDITQKKRYKSNLLNDTEKENKNEINDILSKYSKKENLEEKKIFLNKNDNDINIINDEKISKSTNLAIFNDDLKKLSDKIGDKKESNIELASAEDYLDKETEKRERIHERSNFNKSRSVAPRQNLVELEVSKIINSQIGLNNLGSTCYMNSALQVIIHCKIFIEKIISFKNSTNSITNSFLNICSSLIVSQNKENRNHLSYSYSLNSISPSNFKSLFCLKHSDYMRGQHDSIEFLRTLLDDISKEININQNISAYKELKTEGKSKEEQSKEYHNFYISRENSIIVDIFYNQIINIFTCECGFESYSFQKLLDIPLLLPMKQYKVDMSSLIKEYFKEEELDWSSKCEKCNKEGLKHLKLMKFSLLNEILIFSLQRFDPYLSMKSNIRVSFKEIIDLKDYCDTNLDGQNTKYRLRGTINHIGNINYGHYYAYIRIGELWYEFNDSIVRKCYSMDYDSSSVCVMFYEKM